MRKWQEALKKLGKRKEHASVSLLACICLAGILTLESVLLPASRLRYFEAQIPDFVNMQLKTILASYKRPLFKRYALLAFDKQSEGKDELLALVGKQADTYHFQAEVEAEKSLSETDVLQTEVLQYMKPRWPLAMLQTFKQRFLELKKGLQANSQALTVIGKDVDLVKGKLDSLQQTKGKDKAKWKKLLAMGLEKALDYCFDGYSEYKNLAEQSMLNTEAISSFTNLFNLAKQTMDSLTKLNLPMLDDILINEYLLAFLSSAVRNQTTALPSSNKLSSNLTGRNQSFQSLSFADPYELEACMSMFNGKAAYLQVQTEIFALRFALQFVAVRQNKTQQAIFLGVGKIIELACLIFAITISAEAVCQFLTAVEAAIRAFKELKILKAGRTLGLLPNELVKTYVLPKELATFQHDYFDYARLFLLLMTRKHRLNKLYKAIKANLPADFYCQIRAKVNWQVPKWTFQQGQYQAQLTYLKN